MNEPSHSSFSPEEINFAKPPHTRPTRGTALCRYRSEEEVMSLFTKFFKESDTQLGVFYPNHYVIAVFRNLETAQQAVKKLRLAGFAENRTERLGDSAGQKSHVGS
jgi:hypothetical protein